MSENAVFIENYSEAYAKNKISFISSNANEKIEKFSYKKFKETVNIIGHISFKIIYVFYGFLQFFATWSGLVKTFHHDNIIIQLASLGLGFVPVIGTGFGIYGAHVGWEWNLFNSILIFFIIPYFIVNGPLLMIGCFDIYKDWKRWQSAKKDI